MKLPHVNVVQTSTNRESDRSFFEANKIRAELARCVLRMSLVELRALKVRLGLPNPEALEANRELAAD